MAIFKSEEAREVEALAKVEQTIERREKRERIHHIIIGVLGALLVTSVVTGHILPCTKKRRR